MREAMANAPVGDDVFQEDPSINELEAEAARLFDKEAGLLVASGTQGNLLALLSLTRPGEEVIAEVGSHIANSEVGGAARLGGLTLRPVVGVAGKIQPEQVVQTVRPANVHYARTALLAIENTHNASGGTVSTLAELDALADVASEHGLKMHIDGARIFNAAVALGEAPARLAARADTLTFCLSKGLSAPVGSVLVGSAEVIRRGAALSKDGWWRHAPGGRAGGRRAGSAEHLRRPSRRRSSARPATGRGPGRHRRHPHRPCDSRVQHRPLRRRWPGVYDQRSFADALQRTWHPRLGRRRPRRRAHGAAPAHRRSCRRRGAGGHRRLAATGSQRRPGRQTRCTDNDRWRASSWPRRRHAGRR